ncbi:hypothetical protein P7K49_004539 [Saguinus oedipus]|uniref:Uncharacterized protein n=1 Tax=Saguinus oedipus TaxID=9490 RepID=A0ABQ9WA30_SAGOE|nr:hypothetical protein P7K49_004539 [Saguinus oedipus]
MGTPVGVGARGPADHLALRLDLHTEDDNYAQGRASGGKLQRVSVYLFETGSRESAAALTSILSRGLPLHWVPGAPGAPRSPALLSAPTLPKLSPEQQVGSDEAEQAPQRPLPAQQLVRAAAQPQHWLPEQPSHRGGRPARGLLHLQPRALRRPSLLRFLLLRRPLCWGRPGWRRRLLLRGGSRASLLGLLRGRRARHLRRRFQAGTGQGARGGAPGCGRRGRGGGGRSRSRARTAGRRRPGAL